MKLAGVVILYYPDEKFEQRLSTYKEYLERLIVIDNSEHINEALHAKLVLQNNVTLIHDGKNKGVSERLNKAAQIALTDGFEWLLTMDQDSWFNAGDLQILLQCISTAFHLDVGIYGVGYLKCNAVKTCQFSEVPFLITSGSIINIDAYKKTKGFDEKLFIDHVDHDYCFQVRQKGYKLLRSDNIVLNHTIGTESFHRSLKSLKQSARVLHAPQRIYYIVRNYLYLKRKYKNEFKTDFFEIKRNVLISIKNNILYHRARFRVIKMILAAILDFQKNKMGK